MSAHCTSASSTQPDPKQMARELVGPLGGATPQFGFVTCTVGVDVEALRVALAGLLPKTPFIGVTSCQGVIGESRVVKGPLASAALWLSGDEVRASVSSQTIATPDEAFGRQLAQKATAGLGGAKPSFAVFHGTPGTEEALLRGFATALKGVPLLGGSAADDTISGKWSVFTHDARFPTGAVLALVTWPGKVLTPWVSGAMPSPQKAVVTKAEGRVIHELGGRPAAVVYNEWLSGALDAAMTSGEPIVSKTTLTPLGVIRANALTLVHPERIVNGRSLASFAEVQVGETVSVVRSTPFAMQGRPANLAARSMAEANLSELKGALLFYCAGCMLAIGTATGGMVEALKTVTRKAALSGSFHFGEQGCHVSGPPEHGNLMTGALLLG